MNDTKYWLWLSMIFGTGSCRIWEAMSCFERAADAYDALSSGSMNVRLDEKEIKNIHDISIDKAVSFMEYCEENGIGIIGYSDSLYPPQLRYIFNPPAVLYFKGNISCIKGKRTITSVGTRHASPYGLKAAGQICGELARNGFIIVSGFAVGIDITSHLAAAKANRPTVCVLGCGVDVDYPKENFQYRDLILENGGVFISEFSPGTPPLSPNFPKRNRILAGIGRAAIVFEAGKKSGSLITASFALEQGREVFCLPPADIFSSSYAGNVAFLRDGAQPLYSSDDVLYSFKLGGALDCEIRSDEDDEDVDVYSNISNFAIGELTPKKKHSSPNDKNKVSEKKIKNELKKAEDKQPTINPELYDSLSDIQKKIVSITSGCGIHADVIAQKLEIDAGELMTELTELEIIGAIKSLPGKMFISSVGS